MLYIKYMEQIKQLREKTGAGMVDCKKALDEAGGDIDKAVEILRKKGIAKAAKRGDRETCEGIIKVAANEAGNEGYIVELNAETDFVARNQQFQSFGDNVLNLIKEHKPKNREELLALAMENGTVQENMDNMSGVIGEKIDIKRCDILSSTGTVSAYTHMGGRIGVLVAIDKENMQDLGYDIAMQIAASSPKYLNPEEVPAEEVDKEKEIYREQLLKEGKPENMLDKILEGKIKKYYEDVCLTKQEFIKDDKKHIEDVLNGAKIEKFVRYSL